MRVGALVKESIFCVKTACHQRYSSQVFFNDLGHSWRATSEQEALWRTPMIAIEVLLKAVFPSKNLRFGKMVEFGGIF